MEFSLEKKGYCKKEVETYLKSYKESFEQTLKEQRERIDSLKAENENLSKIIAVYKEKEDCVSEALLSAINKAKEVENAVRIRFAVEGERVKLFQAKWTKYAEKLKNKAVSQQESDSLNDYLESVKAQLSDILSENLNISYEKSVSELQSQFMDESARISRIEKGEKEKTSSQSYEEFLNRLKSAVKKSNDDNEQSVLSARSFTIENTDKKQSLIDICRELRLNN